MDLLNKVNLTNRVNSPDRWEFRLDLPNNKVDFPHRMDLSNRTNLPDRLDLGRTYLTMWTFPTEWTYRQGGLA